MLLLGTITCRSFVVRFANLRMTAIRSPFILSRLNSYEKFLTNIRYAINVLKEILQTYEKSTNA